MAAQIAGLNVLSLLHEGTGTVVMAHLMSRLSGRQQVEQRTASAGPAHVQVEARNASLAAPPSRFVPQHTQRTRGSQHLCATIQR